MLKIHRLCSGKPIKLQESSNDFSRFRDFSSLEENAPEMAERIIDHMKRVYQNVQRDYRLAYVEYETGNRKGNAKNVTKEFLDGKMSNCFVGHCIGRRTKFTIGRRFYTACDSCTTTHRVCF